MESYEDLFKIVCRVCLSYGKKENMLPLHEKNSEDGLSCYGKAIITFADISIKSTDEFPLHMCQNCLKLLQQAIHFKLKCESSNKQLNKLLQNHKNCKTNLKQDIVEYALFQYYFPEESVQSISESHNNNSSRNKSEEINDKSSSESENTFSDTKNDDINHPEQSDVESCDEILDRIENMIGQLPDLPKVLKNHSQRKILRQKHNKHSLLQRRIQSKNKLKRSELSEKYVCKICQKVLANSHTYKYHMQRHNGCKYICEHCGKGFPVLVELQMHQVARHGTGPFVQCPHCTFKAPRKHNLMEHIRIHTGERPYTCDKCGLTFRRCAIWKKHMIYHMEKTVQCPKCPRKFYRRTEMLAHANSIHERMYVYLCHKCDATYAKSETVRRHLVERHGVPRELQGKIVRVNKGTGNGFPE